MCYVIYKIHKTLLFNVRMSLVHYVSLSPPKHVNHKKQLHFVRAINCNTCKFDYVRPIVYIRSTYDMLYNTVMC